MSDGHNTSGSRITVGTILIIVGALYFLQTLDFITFGISHIIFSFPFIIMVIGVLVLINSRNKLFGALLTLIGALTLLPKVLPSFELNENIIFPVILIALGILIVFRRRPGCRHWGQRFEKRIDNDFLDDVAVFGGGQKIIASENFKGGNVTAIFGGSEIDLTQCKLAEGTVVIDTVMIFGGTTFIIPRDWNVRINVMPIFGGFSNKMPRNTSYPIDSTRTLLVKGVAIFGGGEIKRY